MGGIGAEKKIYTKEGIIIDTTLEDTSFVLSKNSQDLFKIDTTSFGVIDINTGDGTTGSLNIKSTSNTDFQSLLQLKNNIDVVNGYSIGRGSSTLYSGRVLSLNIPKYTINP